MNPIVRRIGPDEALRVRALAGAPLAFGSTLAREEAFADEVWRKRAERCAAGGDRWIGMATGLVADGPRLDLVGMFVEPAARGRRVGVALVEAVAAWARERGTVHLYLWATSTNQAALALSHRCDFKRTGRSQPLDHAPALLELEMVRDL